MRISDWSSDVCSSDLTRPGCTTESGRTMVTVMVTGAATAADINVEDIIICEEESAILTPTSSLANPIFNWYRNADKTDKVSNQTIEIGRASCRERVCQYV